MVSLLRVAASVALYLPTALAQCQNLTPASGNPVMASGYQSKLVLNGLRTPRHIAFDKAGNLLIAEQGNVGIRQVKLTDADGLNVCVQSSKVLIQNGQLNHGVAVSDDGKTLYASSAVAVFAYPYDAAAGTVGTARQIISIPRQGGFHQTRTLLIPKNNPNLLLVAVGSQDNVDTATAQESSGRSQVRVFDLTKLTGAAVAYNTGSLLGWGLRNSVGFGEDPSTGGIWSVENSVDDLRRGGVDIHNDNPGEELNYHGVLNDTSGTYYGKNYGYPYCYAIWDTSKITGHPKLDVGSQMIGSSTMQGRTDQACASDFIAPRLTFRSHTAPLDVKFKPDGTAAYISFHGSWNRQPPDGYRLSRIDFAKGQPVEPANSKTAEKTIMSNSNNASCPNRCFRPVGLAFDSKNRLWMTSDSSGELFVVTGV